MKKILLSLLAIIIANAGFAQAPNGITIVSIPDQIEAGTTVNLEFTYTSDVPVNFVVQLFQTNAEDLNSDYSTYQAAVTRPGQPAGTNVAITVPFPVPGNIAPSSALGTREYTFDLKLTPVAGGSDFGYNNNTANNTAEITPSQTLIDNIYFTATTPTALQEGQTLTVELAYTLQQARNLKVGLVRYNTSDGTYAGEGPSGSIQYFNDLPASGVTPIPRTVTITIPGGASTPPALPAGQEYQVVVGINNTNAAGGGYIMDRKRAITINAVTGIDKSNAVASKLNVFPNPASDAVNISYPGTIEAVLLHDASGREMDAEATSLSSGLFNINTSALQKGVYIIQVNTSEGSAFVKLMK